MTTYYDPAISPRPAYRIGVSTNWKDSIAFFFPFDRDINEKIKKLPGWRWDNANKEWRAPNSTLKRAMELLPDFAISEKLRGIVEGTLAPPTTITPEASKPIEVPTDAPQPEGIAVSLFPYQRAGVAFFSQRQYGILADEMGLGKTLQGIAWASQQRPVCVIVPASLKTNWQREIKRARPDDEVVLAKTKTDLECRDWVIINYDILSKFKDDLQGCSFKTALVDEAHYLKNPKAKRTELAQELLNKIPRKLLLTGTPILNRPNELFPLLVAIGDKNPKTDFWWWMKKFTNATKERFHWDFSGASNLDELHKQISPFFLRRLKKDVLADLPEKIQQSLEIELSNAADYNSASQDVIAFLRATAGDAAAFRAARAEILAKMNLLRRLSAEGKTAAAKDILDDYLEEGQQVVVMSTFKEPLNQLHELLPESVLFTGDLSTEARSQAVDEFVAGRKKIFLGTVGAAGVGLNLQVASHMIFLDLPWTPAAKQQAEDRLHRIGQKQSVSITNLIGKGTIDDFLINILLTKAGIIAQLVDADKAVVGAEDVLDNLVSALLGKPVSKATETTPTVSPSASEVSSFVWKVDPMPISLPFPAHSYIPVERQAELLPGVLRHKELSVSPRLFEPKCQTIKTHDDGDKTVKCGKTLFIETTDGKRFREVKDPGIALTTCEKAHRLVPKLERCVLEVKAEGSALNPIAVCRASVSGKVCTK